MIEPGSGPTSVESIRSKNTKWVRSQPYGKPGADRPTHAFGLDRRDGPERSDNVPVYGDVTAVAGVIARTLGEFSTIGCGVSERRLN